MESLRGPTVECVCKSTHMEGYSFFKEKQEGKLQKWGISGPFCELSQDTTTAELGQKAESPHC